MEWSPGAWVDDGRQYLTEVRSEFRKVTWPSQKEYVSGTIGVMIIVAVITTVLGVMDFGLARLVQLAVP